MIDPATGARTYVVLKLWLLGPTIKRAGWQPWHEAPWFLEWEKLAKAGRKCKEPRPSFPDAPESK